MKFSDHKPAPAEGIGNQDIEPSAPDAQWVRSALDQYERPLTIYTARLLGDAERARDVVQDAFLKLWTADRRSLNGHLGQWLYTVCRNRALDIRRKELRMTTLHDTHVERCEDASEGKSNADASRQRIAPLLQALSDRQQEVLRLKFQGGLSYAEIANVMDITANHVGVLIHTAIKAIREKLTPQDIENAPRLQREVRP